MRIKKERFRALVKADGNYGTTIGALAGGEDGKNFVIDQYYGDGTKNLTAADVTAAYANE